jgi:hypothetical protein
MPAKTNPTKTDLVRQRLEALKRQNAMSKPPVASQEPAPSTGGNSPGDSLKDQSNPAEMPQPRTVEPDDVAERRELAQSIISPSLPGLTTSFGPNDGPKNSPSPVKSAVSQSSESVPDGVWLMNSLEPPRPNLRKRPVSADFLDTTATKRRAGPIMQEEETCVIDISDESEDEADEDQVMSDDSPLPPTARPATVSHVPRMPKAEFQNPDKIREATERVEAERRALLDRIARAEKRQREKASNGPTPAQTPSRRSPSIKEQPAAAEAPVKRKDVLDDVLSRRSGLGDAYQVKLKAQAELDAVVASNESKMEELRRQMQALEEENRQKKQDRENLVRELQNLGVDTVGMSHNDLQATKDLIENHIAQTKDLVMADADVRTEAGAEDPSVEQERRAILPDDVQRSDVEEGEWRSSETGNSPERPLPGSRSIPTSHPADPSAASRAQDLNTVRLQPAASQELALQRPYTADSFNSLSSGEILEDDSAMILDLDEPEQMEIIQGREVFSSSVDVFAKNHGQDAISAVDENVERQETSADESNGDEDYEPEFTINDSAPAESGSLALHHAAKACHRIRHN